MSPYKKYANDFVLRFIENGLYNKHNEWVMQLNLANYQLKKRGSANIKRKIKVVINMDLLLGVAAMYMVGVAIALAVFVLELVV